MGQLIVTEEYVFEKAPFEECHAATLAENPDGTLVAAWFGGTREGNPDVAIWSSRRVQGSWTAPVVAADAVEADTPCWNPVLFAMEPGCMTLFYKTGKTIGTWQGERVDSTDGGATWQNRHLLPEFFLGPVKNKPIRLDDGTILCGSSTEHNGWRVHVERLPATGSTWSRTESLNSQEESAIQPTLLTLGDGRIQMLCRPGGGHKNIWQSQSCDGGQTWSKMTPLELPNPCSGIDAVTLKDKRQLLVYNHTNSSTDFGKRAMLNVAVSDDGTNWNAVCILEKEPHCEFSYPAVIQTEDGLVHILYTWKRKKIKHVALDPTKFEGIPIENGQWPAQIDFPGL